MASETTVSGLAFTTGWSQPGMLLGEAKIELANSRGISVMNQTPCAVSGSCMAVATATLTQAKATPKASTRSSPAAPASSPPPKRNPSARPTTTTSATESSMRTVSERMRAMR